MLEPLLDPQSAAGQALVPHLPPPVTDDRRIRGQAVEREHHRRLGQIVREQASAHVVHVVDVQILGGGGTDDRLERRRAAGGHLQTVEPAPRDTHHADIAVAPGLFGEPCDDVAGVVVFGGQILVGEHPVGVSAAAHVHTHGHVAVPGEIGVVESIPRPGQVPLPIRDVLEHRRDRFVGDRAPHTGGQARAVAHGNEHVLDVSHLVRERLDRVH